MRIIDARRSDAQQLAELINLAGEGIPLYLWQGMAPPGQSALSFGTERAARDEGGFSYKNARVCLVEDTLAGMIIAYGQPDPYDLSDLENYPDIVQPLVHLEAKAPGSWYINAVATFSAYRNQGVACRLIEEAEKQAIESGYSHASLIVASENRGARRLYLKLGYEVEASLPVITYPGALHGGDWELMIKQIKRAANR
ncbi:GNAT family N-acetyltransferase [uncultured Neptuniibacter sp.]|uniref:GNAT family N-acetyltransferase n=1 Tax=uncultured Neptuniibacter sp. TaxID=502143 RepID=UPI002616A1CB|nr:GNAT family N-acetyltransferase [uncultured Neptuniibacter sp.]